MCYKRLNVPSRFENSWLERFAPDSCKHVFEGALATREYNEDDSFGPVVRALYCADCSAAIDRAKDWLQCEWCGKRSEDVGTRKSSDSADWYCICASCDRKQWSRLADELDDCDANVGRRTIAGG